MGRNTRIEWTDATWNPVTGCKHGCEYCYARSIAQRFGCKITSDLKESTATAYLTEPYVSKDLSPEERAKVRSKTFPGIAKAMVEQWGADMRGEQDG